MNAKAKILLDVCVYSWIFFARSLNCLLSLPLLLGVNRPLCYINRFENKMHEHVLVLKINKLVIRE